MLEGAEVTSGTLATLRELTIAERRPPFPRLDVTREVADTTICPDLSVAPFDGFGDFIGFVHNGLPRSIVNLSLHSHWRYVTFNSIPSFSSLITT